MEYKYTKIWKINHKLVVADTIEDAINLYKKYSKDLESMLNTNIVVMTNTDIVSIKAIGDGQIPENYDVLIKA